MIKLLTDEDYNNVIVRGVLRRLPGIDIVRVQDVNLMNVHDSIVLAWAAQEKRVVLTHDVTTMLNEAYLRLAEELPMPGIIACTQTAAVGLVIDDLVFAAETGTDADWENQVVFLPL